MRYKITVTRTVTEEGVFYAEAETEEQAQERAAEMLNDSFRDLEFIDSDTDMDVEPIEPIHEARAGGGECVVCGEPVEWPGVQASGNRGTIPAAWVHVGQLANAS